jgi:hypothetical protein
VNFCEEKILDLTKLLFRMVKHFGMQSLIVFFLAGIVFLTTGALIYIGARRIAEGEATWGFKPLCGTNGTNATIGGMDV